MRRCIRSVERVGLTLDLVPFPGVEKAAAIKLAMASNLSIGFDYVEYRDYRPLSEGQIACFLSHRYLWKICVELWQPIMILEHDAVFNGKLGRLSFTSVLNLQRTIWDDTNWKYYWKLRALEDKIKKNGNAKYVCLPGSSAYCIAPIAAERLLQEDKMLPVDLFVNKGVVRIDDHINISQIYVTNDYRSLF